MNRFAIVLLTWLVAACVGGPVNTPAAAVYDFGLPAARLAAEGRWSRMGVEVNSPSWFASLGVDYRLAYHDPLKRHEYAGSRWAGAPAELLARSLQQQLGAVSASGNAVTACLLRVDVQEFSHVFDSPQRSRGVLQAGVSLLDVKRRTVNARQLAIEVPAATPDAPGGVNALVAASTELGRRLSVWLAGLDANDALGSCRGE